MRGNALGVLAALLTTGALLVPVLGVPAGPVPGVSISAAF